VNFIPILPCVWVVLFSLFSVQGIFCCCRFRSRRRWFALTYPPPAFNLVHQPAASGFIFSWVPVLARVFRCELKAPVRSGRFSCHRRSSWIFAVLFSVIAVSLAATVARSENHFPSCRWIHGPRVLSSFGWARSGPMAQLPPKVFFVPLFRRRGPAAVLFVILAGLRFSAARLLVSIPGLVTEVRNCQRCFPNYFRFVLGSVFLLKATGQGLGCARSPAHEPNRLAFLFRFTAVPSTKSRQGGPFPSFRSSLCHLALGVYSAETVPAQSPVCATTIDFFAVILFLLIGWKLILFLSHR
jgi:hypothetical protein